MLQPLSHALLVFCVILSSLLGGCGQTQTQQPDFSFAIPPSATPAQPGTSDAVTLSFSVFNNYFQDFSGMPFIINDSAASNNPVFSGNVTSFGPNAVVPITAVLPVVAVGGFHTYTIILDPGNLVAVANPADKTADITLVYADGDLSFTTTTASVSPLNPTSSDFPVISFAVNYAASHPSAGVVTGLPYTVHEDGALIFSGLLPPLNPNTISIVSTAPLPMSPVGSHTYVVTIDPNNFLPETDETNNTQLTPVIVVPSATG